ncbi:GTPase IMAP family member 1-like isoform X1 [Synchiropus splendidus]|uniref:GTPase IMAP family member 1-like isoform X1 n=1 Tax=Synchiropus splendidus TaxID=270530 RepID=UPI00237DCB66|nr:GTPase IMAP family member 1-like isoform X1 [Synchiropus splendidus]
MECKCDNTEDVSGWWMTGSNIQMGAFTVFGYLLYRFSQTLPALIRWPIRFFCSITGLSTLWGWVSRIVGTLRGIQSLCKWFSRIWKFFKALASKFQWLSDIINTLTGSTEAASHSKPDLRLILVGPAGGGRTSVANTLLGSRMPHTAGTMVESTRRRTVVAGSEVTVIDTPDLLSPALGTPEKIREALRSIQLSSPGPNAVLLVMRAPGANGGMDHDAAQAVKTILQLYDEDIVNYIIPVLTHADCLDHTLEDLLDRDTAGLRRAVSLCGQRPELVDTKPKQSREAQLASQKALLGRVLEMKTHRGHFKHQLQIKEEQMREKLLMDMTHDVLMKHGLM